MLPSIAFSHSFFLGGGRGEGAEPDICRDSILRSEEDSLYFSYIIFVSVLCSPTTFFSFMSVLLEDTAMPTILIMLFLTGNTYLYLAVHVLPALIASLQLFVKHTFHVCVIFLLKGLLAPSFCLSMRLKCTLSSRWQGRFWSFTYGYIKICIHVGMYMQ